MDRAHKSGDKKKYQYFNRDLSWLQFNYRVLLEGMDKDLPLYDRIKFLAIYSSNLDEFFRVRVAALLRIAKIDKPKLSKQLHIKPKSIIREIQDVVNKQLDEYGHYLRNSILPELEENGISLYMDKKIESELLPRFRHIFNSQILAYLQPVVVHIDAEHNFSLKNRQLYFALKLKSKEAVEFIAFVNIPSDKLPRFYSFKQSAKSFKFILLDDILRQYMSEVFPDHKIIECISVKLNRDADLEIDDEFSGDLVEKLRKQIKKRNIGPPARFLYDAAVSEDFLNSLKKLFQLDDDECVKGGKYHNLDDLMQLENPYGNRLKESSIEELFNKEYASSTKVFDLLQKKDVLFHFPYYSFDPVLRLFNEAAIDPLVRKIKVTLYRIAKESVIANALISAAKNGKEVTVFMEVKARFDEENNLLWAQRMEEAGVSIIYSMPGLKVHAKVALVEKRLDSGKTFRYAYLGTGNLNENTAEIYTDHGLMTSNKELTSDLNKLFNYLHKQKPIDGFRKLLVSQFNMKNTFLDLVDKEIANAKKGHVAKILIKLNNLEHEEMINKLYEANNAGVEITLLIRGICTLRPNIKGQSEGIKIYRLVDKFLEHPRIFVFHNSGNELVYLGSADWMTRNLEHRIEVVFPLTERILKDEILQYLKFQLNDDQKLVQLNENHEMTRVKADKLKPFRAQLEIYKWLEKKDN